MPVQNSPLERQTKSQARAQAVLTSTQRVTLDGTPAVPQLRAHLDRGPIMEGAEPSRKAGRGSRRSSSFSGVVGSFPGTSRTIFKGPGEDDEKEESDGTEVVPAPVGPSQGTEGPALAQSNQSVCAYFRSLVSQIVDWVERALINYFREGLASRILDKLASHPSILNGCYRGT
ncbi:hypothetical protein O181_064052 [Austropuccinia psidii MF-1]|uniref:Uncharacterized protein n=1 Tax=Austropuccinia psidii MF-1 TaxID=1389203 RepID=A0A9Q3I1X9_9BASI|nr:hypothetical protein [Austropuccinia psidii MF-1]